MRNNKFLFILLTAALVAFAGCGSSSSSTEAAQSGTGGGVSDTLLGSGNGSVSLYAKSAEVAIPSTSVSARSAKAKNASVEKVVSYGGGQVDAFQIEFINFILNAEDGSTVTIAVNSTIDIANPSYDDYINFLVDQTVAAGNYTSVDVQLGTVNFDATGISPDPTATIEAYSNQTISLDINFSITADGELALPLVLDVETILASGFTMSMDTPFAIRVSILPLQSGGSIWTTGDMVGFADDSGNLYEIDDPSMTTAVGTYTESSATTGSYLFTGGTYIGIQGTYVINPGGSFSGDAVGFFTLNGNYDGGYWVTDNGDYGTFALTSGWVPNGTGTFTGLNMTIQGTIELNADASGGTWEATNDNSSGTFMFE